jgi:hypothetical protein
MSNLFKIISSMRPHCQKLLGRMCPIFTGLMFFSCLFTVLALKIKLELLDWMTTGLIILAILAFIIGVFSGQKKPRPFEGFVSGAVAGLVAACVGGASYYAIDVQDCTNTSNSAIKLVRLVVACPLFGLILGWFIGLTLPNLLPKVPSKTTPGKNIPPIDPENVFWLIASFIAIGTMATLYVVVFNNVEKYTDLLGADQPKLVFWQYLMIVGSFSSTLVYICIKRFNWGIGKLAARKKEKVARQSALIVLAWAVPTGIILWLAVGNVDMGVRDVAIPVENRICARYSWEISTVPQVSLRIIALFIWMVALSYLGLTRTIIRHNRL